MSPKVNEKAPDFEAPDTALKMRKLSEFRGQNVVLAFFPGAFTSVCTKEMCTFRDSMANFNKFKAKVIGISVDSPFSLAEFAKKNNLTFDLLSDSNREISKKYDVLHQNFAGVPGLTASKRSVFIIDGDGIVRYAWVSDDPGKEPDYKAIQEFLSKMN
ncbi:bacterioferritin comigratory protein [Thermoplasma volcanium GSS1]|uniref:Bacterioferritin comigratory protein n=1 Tax=Thermoplasma volcanium (strain ATCC 51530 / DSM 4299 / JCM 9571 / NBRC 15438 / GSS1) TaxID=273116 RepID=Q97C16_THEVO|nr:peroxiredoxin [Thermoplasma volcanium]BAB59431.1 bacterioferritin comigratory protein [Thermoplasma volcanium GSS1]